MKIITLIISIFISFSSSEQNNLMFLFDFDSTKIYLKYMDLKPYIKKQNIKVNEISKLSIKNDTIKLDGYYLHSSQRLDSLSFNLDKEMFSAIDNKKASIIFQGKTISAFYTKKN